jgi:hypothetical protein
MAPSTQSFARRLLKAAQLPVAERTADAAAFVDSVSCLKEVCQLLPIDAQGRPTLKDATTARSKLLLAAAKAARAQHLSLVRLAWMKNLWQFSH